MTDTISLPGDFSSALRNRPALTAGKSNAIEKLNTLASSPQAGIADSDQIDEARAREVANKFESLLLHNMLKSMRKTTLAENTSNAKAVYDDMLDEQLADTMMQAGGIGIADQIVAQIRQQQGVNAGMSIEGAGTGVLPKLSTGAISYNTSTSPAHGDQLSMATSLWSTQQHRGLSNQQQKFLEPLMPHIERNAQKLGTSPTAILAIAALETGWGRAMIKNANGSDSNNLFGIKATGTDTQYATTLTTEYIEGNPQKLKARFKTYANAAAAVDGFADFILANPRYSKALEHASNPVQFLKELQNAGYATDPRYAEKAISIMRKIAGDSRL